MPIPTNNDRAKWARFGLDAFAAETGIADEDMHLQVGDLLADLMHLADYEGLDWRSVMARAKDHYQAEVYEQGRASRSPKAWSPRGRHPR